MALPTPSVFVKRGATFSLAGFVTLPDGVWVATSELKSNNGDLIAELEVTLEHQPLPDTRWGILLYTDATVTAEWPLGPLSCDIRFQYSNSVIYSPTFVVNVVKEITDSQPTLILRAG